MSQQTAGRRPGLVGRTGRACYRHRRLTVTAWLAGLAALITLWLNFGAAADNSFSGSDPGQALLSAHFRAVSGDSLTLAIRSAAPVGSAAARSRITAVLVPFRRAAGVSSVTGPYSVPGHISADGHTAFATIAFAVPSTSIPTAQAQVLMADARAASGHGITFSLGGDIVDLAETPYGGPTEGIGILAAAVVLLIAFGSLLAMGLPVVTALFGIGTGLSLIALLGHLAPAPSFSPIIASMIGLGVGVDYALFIVTRYREAAQSIRGGQVAGGEPRGLEDAVVTAMQTAGRSVLIAGSTVIIGLLGLLVLRLPLLTGVAIAAAVTVAMTVLGSLTLLPALIGFAGDRLARPSRLRPPRWLRRRRAQRHPGAASAPAAHAPARPERLPAAQRWALLIQRRPVLAAVGATAVILALAAPALGIKLSMPDESAQARGTMGYASYATMARGFGPGFDAPLIVVARLPRPGASMARLDAAVRATPGVAAVAPVQPSRDGRAAVLTAYPRTGEQDPATNALVNRLIGTVLPAATRGTAIKAYLTGPNAGNVAFADTVSRRLPWLVAVVVVLSMLLLLVVFRSVAVAVKAAVMNLVSISAAYGVLVLISQHGLLRQLFGFPEAMPVTTWVPIFLFVVLFGLSMDYEVFLISRIREAHDATGDNAGSVAIGLASTARVITAAAAIMVVVFASFVLGPNVSVKQFGLGLAVAVLLDASVVRMVLVPAVMELLGAANWWLPRPLARLLPAPSVPADRTGPLVSSDALRVGGARWPEGPEQRPTHSSRTETIA